MENQIVSIQPGDQVYFKKKANVSLYNMPNYFIKIFIRIY